MISYQHSYNTKRGKNMIADMHTHSENSHDSVCKIEDMYNAQMACGTEIFAVTDHFDTYSFNDYDIFTPIRRTYDTVRKLNEKNGGRGLILAGVEISENFWFPEEYEKIKTLADFDVVIGSVHCVKHDGLTRPYFRIDFEKLDKKTVIEYIDSYFNDIGTMLETLDCDIVAHLTCPLRYINGKYRREVDISQLEEKIEELLCRIISSGKALEVNTSSLSLLKGFMPDEWIISLYRKLGGELITLGSDAHVAENASMGFDKAIETLKKIGFEEVYYYQKRIPKALKI